MPVPKKAVRKTTSARKASATNAEKPIGVVTHYYGEIGVAIVKFKKPVKTGVQVAFRGHTTDFSETVSSMQYDHKAVDVAPKGKEVGIKVGQRVRDGDEVFLA